MRFRRTDKTTRTLFFHIFSSSSFHKNVCASILLSLSFLLLHQIYLWRRISFPAGWSGGGSCCHSVIISSHSAECRILFFRSNRQPGFVKNRWQIAKLYGKENFCRHDGIVNEEFIARPKVQCFSSMRICVFAGMSRHDGVFWFHDRQRESEIGHVLIAQGKDQHSPVILKRPSTKPSIPSKREATTRKCPVIYGSSSFLYYHPFFPLKELQESPSSI